MRDAHVHTCKGCMFEHDIHVPVHVAFTWWVPRARPAHDAPPPSAPSVRAVRAQRTPHARASRGCAPRRWVHDHGEVKREAAYKESLLKNDSLEGQLRLTQYEMSQLVLLKAAQDDELLGLRQAVAASRGGATERRQALADASSAKKELKELGELYREIKDDYDAMEQRCRGADTELASQRQGSEELLRRLLAEQVRPPPRDLPRSPAFSDRL